MLALPSGGLLQMYKNSCAQNPGLNESVGQWMAMEASKRQIGPEDREGWIILDEMAIQVSGKASYITLFALGASLHPKSDKQNAMRKIKTLSLFKEKYLTQKCCNTVLTLNKFDSFIFHRKICK